MATKGETKTQLDEKTFSFEWEIPNWNEIKENIDEILKQTFIFNILLFPTGNVSWEIGFLKKKKDISICPVKLYQKLVRLPVDLKELDTFISISLLDNTGAVVTQIKGKKHFREKNVHTFETAFRLPGDWSSYTDPTGAIKFAIGISVRFSLDLVKTERETLLLRKFNDASSTTTCKNWATLLRNMNDFDLKIITRDNKEILAHKLVLKVQCPLFASDFSTKFSGNTTSTINTTEISAKTMTVLLNYFYSGQLLESWCDDNVIVELTAAVERYKMDEVAELLDQILGNPTKGKCNWKNDWKLLKLVRKMSLKQAEKRLNYRILCTARSVQTADELIALFREVIITDDDKEEPGMLVRAKLT